MATPSAAGSAALVRDYLITNRNITDPQASLIKAILIAGANDLPGSVSPNSNSGFGRINLSNSLPAGNGSMNFTLGNLSTGGSYTYDYYFLNTQTSRFALVWTDPPCISSCNTKALVNELVLKVTLPNGTVFYGNSRGNSSAGPDLVNNAQIVELNPVPGMYVVNVSGYNVPQGPQNFSLVVVGGINNTNTTNTTPGPVWSGNASSIVPAYSPLAQSYFNISWTDGISNISSVLLESNYSGTPTNYTMSLLGGSTYGYSAVLPAGAFYWKAYANDTGDNQNVSNAWPFTIAQAAPALTLTLNGSASNLSYAYNPAFSLQITASSTTGNQSIYLNGALVGTSSYSAVLGAGYYNITAITPANQNYTGATVSYFANVSQANATISVTPYSVTYNGSAFTATGTATGVNSANLSSDLNLAGTTHTNAGTYATDTWTFTDPTGNYKNTSGTVSDSISQANATISVTPYSVTYDGSAHTAVGTATGANGQNLSSDLNLAGTTHTNAGTYAADAWTFTDPTGNYRNTSGTVSDSISQANATISVTPYSVTYNGSAFTATGTATGVNSQNLSSDLNLTGTTHTAAGNYNDTWTFTDPAGNYKNASGTVSDSIAQATDAPVLLINGSAANFSQTIPFSTGITCTDTVSGNHTLYQNGIALNSSMGTSVTATEAYPTAGYYNITCMLVNSNYIGQTTLYINAVIPSAIPYFVSPTPANNINDFTYPITFNMTANSIMSGPGYIQIDGVNQTCTPASDNLSCSYTIPYANTTFNHTYSVEGWANISGTYYATNETSVPYYGCGNVNSSGTLLGNISINGSTCFTITASSINFNGNGYTITGDGAYNTYGLVTTESGVNNENFGNLSITNFNYGFYTVNNQDNTFTNCTAYNNQYGFYIYSSITQTITNDSASNNAYGFFVSYAGDNILTNNTAYNNTNYGFEIRASSIGNILANNTANGNGVGFYTTFYSQSYPYSSPPADNTFTGNTAFNNTAYQIEFYLSSNNTVYNNIFNATGSEGVAYEDATSTNSWNTAETAGTNIIGGPNIGGNWYSNYYGTENGTTGIGLTQYNISGGSDVDSLPLTGNTTSLNGIPPAPSNPVSSIPATYSPSTQSYFNITWNDSAGITSALLESNYSGTPTNYTMNLLGGSTYGYSAVLPAGAFYWKAYASDAQGNTNVSPTAVFTIAQGAAAPVLLIDSAAANLTQNVPFSANLSCTDVISGNHTIYQNGTALNSSIGTSVTATGAYSSAGYYNITCSIAAQQNYTAGQASLYITAGSAPPSSWANSTYSRCENITLINAPGSVLTNFTELINLTYNPNMQPNYSDLIFYNAPCNAGGSVMPFEMENYTPANAYVWLLVPTLNSGNNTVSVYYGNVSPISSLSNPPAAWDNNYVGVWHLQNINSAPGGIVDSKHLNNGTASPSVTAAMGLIGGSANLTNISSANITIPNSPSLNITRSITVSAWIKPAAFNSYAKYVAKSYGSGNPYQCYSLNFDSASHARFELGTGTADNSVVYGATALSAGTWYYVVGTWNGTAMTVYLDGNSSSTAMTASALSTSTWGLTMGVDGYGNVAENYKGLENEVEVSNVARSAAWIDQSYQTQLNNSAWVVFGPQQTG
jgi:parallel beta-helix repeat protein